MAGTLDPSAVLAQAMGSYLRLPLSQKILFPLLIVGSVWGIIFVSDYAARPDYAVLYSDLDPGDAGAVIERLKDQKIKFQIRGDGGTVAISPPDLIHELRLSLAQEGLPKGGSVGFELFDTTALGTTGFAERIKFLRVIQGELERTIASLDAVASARVHITQPEKTVFAKRGSDPTASVMIRFRPGGELDRRQVKGISNMVAGSVEGLVVENVTIIDVYGNLLTQLEEEGADGIGGDSRRLEFQRNIERSFVKRIESMLQKVLGPGKAVARVTADLDFSLNEREEESFDPGGQVIRSEKVIDQGFGAAERGGIPGVVSNLSADQNLLTTPGSKGNSSRSETVRNYEVSRAVTRTAAPQGKLLRLSVAVLVDGQYRNAAIGDTPAGEGAASGGTVYSALDAETMSQIEEVVKNAVGFDVSRGDTLSVQNLQFNVPEDNFADVMDAAAQQDLIFNVISKTIPALFILLFFLMVVRPLVKFMVTPTEAEVDLTRLLPTGIEELETELSQERTQAAVPEMEPVVDIEALEGLMAENSLLVKENPQQAALLIRYWLNDGRI